MLCHLVKGETSKLGGHFSPLTLHFREKSKHIQHLKVNGFISVALKLFTVVTRGYIIGDSIFPAH